MPWGTPPTAGRTALTERLHRIEHDLKEIRRLADPDDSAESPVETLDDVGEPSTEQTTEQVPEA